MFPAINISKQQKLDADQKAIQKINFIGNVGRVGNNFFFPFFHVFQKKPFYIFNKELWEYSNFILFSYNINIK